MMDKQDEPRGKGERLVDKGEIFESTMSVEELKNILDDLVIDNMPVKPLDSKEEADALAKERAK